jgi:hypothetical protein
MQRSLYPIWRNCPRILPPRQLSDLYQAFFSYPAFANFPTLAAISSVMSTGIIIYGTYDARRIASCLCVIECVPEASISGVVIGVMKIVDRQGRVVVAVEAP